MGDKASTESEEIDISEGFGIGAVGNIIRRKSEDSTSVVSTQLGQIK